MVKLLFVLSFMVMPAFAKTDLTDLKKPKIVIIASYRKYYDQVYSKIEEFEKAGGNVIMPPKAKVVDAGAEYIRFDTDNPNIPMKFIELSFLDAVKRADLIYVLNPKGYIGLSSAFEMGYAFSTGKPIICMEPPMDPNLGIFCKIEKQ